MTDAKWLRRMDDLQRRIDCVYDYADALAAVKSPMNAEWLVNEMLTIRREFLACYAECWDYDTGDEQEKEG